MQLYHYQFAHNALYGDFCRITKRTPEQVHSLEQLPYLPVSLFKTHDIRTGYWAAETTFTSSGTTGSLPSRHQVRSLDWYIEVCERCFRGIYGDPRGYAWLGLLPGYLERSGSSLITMMDHFIRRSEHSESGFFLHDHQALQHQLQRLVAASVPVILLGVTHALLDFAEAYPGAWGEDLIVVETGGMKGRRPELIRDEVHQRLCQQLGLPLVHAEYGMTELFSQAWSKGKGLFLPGPTMHVTVRDIHDPFFFPGYGRTGVLCVIDLANVDTVAYVATEDLGRVYPDGSFEVLGRMDGSDLRGCNLLISEIRGNG
jgi:hypothetical protein